MADDVAVLGAGIVGICTALSLAERGVPVTVIDRGAPGQETSYGNAGVISPWSVIPQSMPGLWRQIPWMMRGPYRPLNVRLAYWPRMLPWGLRFLRQGTEARVRRTADAMEMLCAPSVELYRRHLAGTGADLLVRDSAYVHAFRDGSRATMEGLGYRIRQEKGARMELLGADALHRLEPALSTSFQGAVVIHDQARALAPGRLASVLADKARALGVRFETARITAIARGEGGRWTVRAADRTFSAARVVVALGAWSADLLRPLGIKVPLATERGYHLQFPKPGVEIHNSVMDTDAKIVASSMEGGARFAGQAEFGDLDAPPDPAITARIARQARAMFPDMQGDAPRAWMGRRPSLPDSLPAIGTLEGLPGLHVNFGHSHYGLMMAPKSGEVIADLMIGRHANAMQHAIDPGRF
ncbi:MAG: FAD-dependent oxidoreductase [Pseudomonadota bacterium]